MLIAAGGMEISVGAARASVVALEKRLFFHAGNLGGALGFAPDAGDGDGPERNQVDSGYELSEKGRQKFPVPSEEVNHEGGDAEVEDVIGGRDCAGNEQGQQKYLQGVGHDGEQHGGAELRAGGDSDVVVGHDIGVASLILDEAGARLDVFVGSSDFGGGPGLFEAYQIDRIELEDRVR